MSTDVIASFDWKGQARPPSWHSEVKRRAVAALLPAVLQWVNSSGEDAFDEEDMTAQLAAAFDSDGYNFARKLDRAGWNPDSELVDILDGASFWHAHEACVAEWMAQNGVTAKLAVGERVLLSADWVHKHTLRAAPAGQMIGEITAIRGANYTVFVEAMGHVKEGVGTHGMICPFEKIEAMQRA